jgi:PAS domain S-box-containing protein
MAAATFVPAATTANGIGLTSERLARAVFAVTFAVIALLWGLSGRQAREERANAVRSLRESEQRYRVLFESSPEPMWLYDLETARLVDMNAAALALYGLAREEARQREVTEFADEAGSPAMHEMLARNRGGEQARVESTHRMRDGGQAQVEIVSSPVELAGRHAGLAVLRDVTATRRMADQLRHAAQMEAVGRLAGGIAHDFNNLLTAITGYADLLLQRAPPGPLTRYGTEIKHAADAAAGLTRQLLAFSRKQVLQPRVVDLNAVMRDADRMLRRLIGEDIELIAVYADGAALVRADPVQLEQVILNLAVNARDAMPEGGRLLIQTHAERVGPGRDIPPGPYVALTVSDTGSGMTDEVREHIFEPFFTTKGPGQGTGLGLATVYGVVTQSGGSVSVESTPGAGTTFSILLPRTGDPVETPRPTPALVSGGSETVMVVEDEVAIRVLTEELLGQLGYDVLVAESCPGALEMAQRHAGPIHLLLTDVIMPVMPGPELARRVTQLHPETKVLFMSGYTGEMITTKGILFEGTALLEKPFTLGDLGGKVRAVLDAA